MALRSLLLSSRELLALQEGPGSLGRVWGELQVSSEAPLNPAQCGAA